MGMESIREIYRIGRGPSSSHTMGPEKACKYMMSLNLDCDSYRVILFGSLAFTGKGHGTDRVIEETFDKPCNVIFDYEDKWIQHPNTMEIVALKNGKEILRKRFLSIGGGKIEIVGEKSKLAEEIYELSTFKDIVNFCEEKDMSLWQYVEFIEGESIYEYILSCWHTMKDTIKRGLSASGVLPGGLNVNRKAKILYEEALNTSDIVERETRLVSSYAFALSEENAASNLMVTSPTCGASGVLPAVLYYYQGKNGYTDREIVHAMYTGGLIGTIVKANASISGAECGCQAEIGTACSMASAALAELFGYDFDEIEYAAEMAMEHHLGLTCDPIKGLVQIPCIERNSVAAIRAIHAATMASVLADKSQMNFDDVVIVMKKTGADLNEAYRETSIGGLAKITEIKKKISNRIVRKSIINKH